MAETKRKRPDPRTQATRNALIEAAEALFAEFGFEAVSLRQIGAAIGSNNHTVVAYHFGTKEDLIQAIYLHRLPALEARRRELIAEAEAAGTELDVDKLLEIIWLPLFEQVDTERRHSYGRFLCVLLREGLAATRMLVNEEFQTSVHLWNRVMAQLGLPADLQPDERLYLPMLMALESLNLIDKRKQRDFGGESDRQLFYDALAMCRAALIELSHRTSDTS